MKTKRILNKVFAWLMVLAMSFSMCQVSVFAQTYTSDDIAALADGTYKGSATCEDVDEDFNDYDVSVSVVVEGGAIKSIDATCGSSDDMDQEYFAKAATDGNTLKNGTYYEAVIPQIIAKNSTADIDTVSKATCSSKAIIAAVENALEGEPEVTETPGNTEEEQEDPEDPEEPEEPEETEDESDAYYVTMNIPYADFVAAVAPDAQEASEYSADGADTRTYATSKYGISSDGACRGTSGTSKGTYNNGTSVKGVYYAVKMDADTYEALKDSGLTIGDDYYFDSVTTQAPESYLTLTYSNGSYSFSSASVANAGTAAADISAKTYTSSYGDYMFELLNVSNSGTVGTTNIGGEEVTIAIEILDFADGSQLVMYNVDNIWMGSRYNHQIAWSVVGGRGLYKGHNSSSNPLNYQYTMSNYTLSSVKVITDKGTYTYTCSEAFLPYYTGSGEVTVEANEGDTEISVSVPSEFEGVTVSVYYTSGSGREASTVYVAEAASIVEGKVALTSDIDGATNGTYTILVESTNYAPTQVTFDPEATEAQLTELEELVKEAEELISKLEAADMSHSLLKEHAEEGAELLKADSLTSSEASEIISELNTYIVESEAMLEEVYVLMNIPYADFVAAVASKAQQAVEYSGTLTGDDLDTVSYATTKYGVSSEDGGRTTTGTAKGTYNDGTYIKGVYYAVKTYAGVLSSLDSGLGAGDDYYFTDLDEDPTSYLTLTVEDGVIAFDAETLVSANGDGEDADIDSLTYTSSYGDYMFAIKNVKNKDDDLSISTTNIDGAEVTIAIEILEFSDGSQLVMYNVDNIWMGTRYDHQIAWSVKGGKGLRKGHNGSDNPLNYQYEMTDYTLTSVTVITDAGSYVYNCEVELLEYYTGDEVVVEAKNNDEEISVSVPEGFENVKVSVYYTTGSGRNASTVYVAEAASIVEGKVALDEAIDCDTNGTYTILIESDNYAPITVTLEVPMTDAQKETLESLIKEGSALLEDELIESSSLEAHIEEAKELLDNEEATYSEAAELIEELEGFINEIYNSTVYAVMNIPYADFVEAVASEAQQAVEYSGTLAGEELDAVSYATSKYGIDNTVEGGKRGTSGTSKGTYNDGTYIQGVYYPVAMTYADYTVIYDAALGEGDDYYISDVTLEAAESYLVVAVVDDALAFDGSKIAAANGDGEDADIDAFTYTSSYGDYMFELLNVSNSGTVGTTNIDGEEVTIAIEILEFADGSQLVMYNVDNIWMGSRYNHQIAWSVVNGKGLYKGHNSSSNPLNYQYTMTDYTLSSVTVITDKGSYVYNCEVELLEYYAGDGEVTVSATDGEASVNVSIPEGFENAVVSVYYSVTEGRSSTAVYVAEKVSPDANGDVALESAIDCDTYGTYTILVESDNYAPITVTLDPAMSSSQNNVLEDLIAEAEALIASDLGNNYIEEHLAEAIALIESGEASYSEAAELIEELSGYILEVKAANNLGEVIVEVSGVDVVLPDELTQEDAEAVANGYTVIYIIDIQTEVDEVAAALIAELAGDAYSYSMDISIYRYLLEEGYKAGAEVSELLSEITITMDIPEALLEEIGDAEGEYSMIRVHDGEAVVLEGVSVEDGKITFSSKLFSAYAIVYTAANTAADTSDDNGQNEADSENTSDESGNGNDTEDSSDSSDEDTSDEGASDDESTDADTSDDESDAEDASSTTSETTTADASAATGDAANSIWLLITVLASLGLVVEIIRKQRSSC